jgi:phosphoglycolate phosphatase-like HAD superfamily hydrolase
MSERSPTVRERGSGAANARLGRPARGPLDDIELIIFDKDGTLIEFHLMWAEWVEVLARRLEAASGLALREGLYPLLGVDRATGLIHAHGLMAATPMSRIREVVQAYVEGAGAGPAHAAAAVREAWHAPDPVALAQPVTDLRALLTRLRKRVPTFAVATSDDRDPTERTLAALGVAGEFAALSCADDGIRTKPAPDPVLHLCGRLGVAPGRTAVVGDSPADLAMGRSAGVARSIGVLTGVGDRASLEPLADLVLDSIADLAPA